MNILRLVEVENIFHVSGVNNVADIGTKSELDHRSIVPGSLFNKGPGFLSQGPSKAVSSGVLTPIQEVKLEEGEIRQVHDGLAAKCRMPNDYLLADLIHEGGSKEGVSKDDSREGNLTPEGQDL